MDLYVVICAAIVMVNVSAQRWPKQKDLSRVNPVGSLYRSRLSRYHDERRRQLHDNPLSAFRSSRIHRSYGKRMDNRNLQRTPKDSPGKAKTYASYLRVSVGHLRDATQEAKEKAREAFYIMKELRRTMEDIRKVLIAIQQMVGLRW